LFKISLFDLDFDKSVLQDTTLNNLILFSFLKGSFKSQREGGEKAFNLPIAIFVPIIKTALSERTAYCFTKQI